MLRSTEGKPGKDYLNANGEKPDEKTDRRAVHGAALICAVGAWRGSAARRCRPPEAYCIIDADTGLVLAQQNMDEELHPASITKVMTLGLACEKAQGQWDGVRLTVTHEDVYSLAGTDSSHIALQEGEMCP